MERHVNCIHGGASSHASNRQHKKTARQILAIPPTVDGRLRSKWADVPLVIDASDHPAHLLEDGKRKKANSCFANFYYEKFVKYPFVEKCLSKCTIHFEAAGIKLYYTGAGPSASKI